MSSCFFGNVTLTGESDLRAVGSRVQWISLALKNRILFRAKFSVHALLVCSIWKLWPLLVATPTG